ncbi:hypothetical protein FH608_009235 [Nonomuraea phyllanthi]|uniref:Uncharacterized protein n=1 Tax=Nonomuraea phyllanthi TaxID=2219224 RepID=A0A5C4WQ10_9ACTN|nr:hypothetical protein [Nonomuraea phyllanthi]KAB8195692.1 hypothetical protein FH608_009235 [Nonomuraea phyllanthi]QFY07134.1 hypothetical protein GBF35_10945 [Nonomuraea phyllanthi]
MPKTPKSSPPKTAKIKANRARRRRLLHTLRLAVQKEKAERVERHAGIRQAPRAGRPRTRRPSRR